MKIKNFLKLRESALTLALTYCSRKVTCSQRQCPPPLRNLFFYHMDVESFIVGIPY